MSELVDLISLGVVALDADGHGVVTVEVRGRQSGQVLCRGAGAHLGFAVAAALQNRRDRIAETRRGFVAG